VQKPKKKDKQPAPPKPMADSSLADYDEAIGLLHKKQWKKAAAIFEKIVAEADSPHVADRARQNLEVCRRRQRETQDSDDPYLQAVFEKNRGELDAALKLCEQHGKGGKDERFAYLAASIRALAGDEDKAIELLEKAIRLDPKNRVHAYHDPDFKPLHKSDAFRSLTTGSS
jgi:tetratricopeptide (TPR) repeat protein